MAINGNTRDEDFRNHEDEGEDCFTKHNERMKRFRESHGDCSTTGIPNFNMMVSYDSGYNLAETGGAVDSIDISYWLTLIPLQEVTERRFIFN